MPIANEINLPDRPKEPRKWFVQGFNFLGAMKQVARKFNIYQWIFAGMVITTAIKEFTNEHMSVFWYILTFIVLLASLANDRRIEEKDAKKDAGKR